MGYGSDWQKLLFFLFVRKRMLRASSFIVSVTVASTIAVVVQSHSGCATERNDRSDWEMALGLGRNGEGMYPKYQVVPFRNYIISFERISAWV